MVSIKMKSISNNICHWCLCRHCSRFKCPRENRCIDCKYLGQCLECSFFTHKKIKHFKVTRKRKVITPAGADRLIELLELLLEYLKACHDNGKDV